VAASFFAFFTPPPDSIGCPAARLSHPQEYCVEFGNNRRLAEFHLQMEKASSWRVRDISVACPVFNLLSVLNIGICHRTLTKS
jgi:hypothetical protein